MLWKAGCVVLIYPFLFADDNDFIALGIICDIKWFDYFFGLAVTIEKLDRFIYLDLPDLFTC